MSRSESCEYCYMQDSPCDFHLTYNLRASIGEYEFKRLSYDKIDFLSHSQRNYQVQSFETLPKVSIPLQKLIVFGKDNVYITKELSDLIHKCCVKNFDEFELKFINLYLISAVLIAFDNEGKYIKKMITNILHKTKLFETSDILNLPL